MLVYQRVTRFRWSDFLKGSGFSVQIFVDDWGHTWIQHLKMDSETDNFQLTGRQMWWNKPAQIGGKRSVSKELQPVGCWSHRILHETQNEQRVYPWKWMGFFQTIGPFLVGFSAPFFQGEKNRLESLWILASCGVIPGALKLSSPKGPS